MKLLETAEARLVLSLLIGLLLGVERERRKHERGHDSIAGLRTFTLVALLGGLASYINASYAVVVGALIVGAIAVAGYALDPDRQRDAGVTTEVALVVTYVLGALALTHPHVAGIATIVVAALLYFRGALHGFVREALREHEIHDGLLLLVFAFVILPLAPDLNIGPYDAINPQAIARLMLVVTFITAGGYVAQRLLGARLGLVASGFTSGFVSSTATIAALGVRTREDPSIARESAAGAVSSSIATVVQYAVIVAAIDSGLLHALMLPLGLALFTALATTAWFARTGHTPEGAIDAPKGRAFQILPPLAIGAGSALVAVLAAAFDGWIGDAGMVLVASASGFADAHATSGSIATLHHSARIDTPTAQLALIAALSTNTVTKVVVATAAGTRAYSLRVAIAVVLIAASAWLGLLIG